MKTVEEYREEYATKFGLPVTARYTHAKDAVEHAVTELFQQHPYLAVNESAGRALARLDAKVHRREQAKAMIAPSPSLTQESSPSAAVSYKYELWVIIVVLLVIMSLLAGRAHAQVDAVRVSASGVQKKQWAGGIAKLDFGTGLVVDCVSTPGTCSVTAGGGGTGLLTLNGLTADPQTFAKVNDTNVTLTIGSVTSTHTFTMGWTGSLSVARGGTGSAANTGSAGKVLIGNGSGAFIEGDPLVQGLTAHDAAGSSTNPVAVGGYASAAAPSDVSTDVDIVRAWFLKNGAQVFGIQAAGALIGGDAANGLDVDVTRLPALVAGSAIVGKVGIDQTTPGTTNAVAATNLPTTVDTNSGVKSASTLRVVLATDQPALTNKLLVTPDSVALPANQSVNVNQIAGTAADVNSGVKSAGTLRVVLATDQPALTNKLLVTPDSVALPANQSVNINQINSVTPLMGNGTTGTGSPRVTLASDGTAISTTGYMSVKIDQTTPGTTNAVRPDTSGATGAAPPARADFVGGIGSGATGGFVIGVPVGDTYKNINVSTATTTLLVTGVSGRQVRISALHMITSIANNVAFIEGTGATCGTGTAGMAGGTTAATGYNLAANGGIAFGSGLGTVMQTATTGDSVCVVTSAAAQLSGGLQYTIY